MAGRVKHVETDAIDGELLPVGEPHRHDVGLRLLSHYRNAMGAVAQCGKPGDVVGMQVCVDRLDQLHVELTHELEITIDLLQYRVDDQRLAAAPAGGQIGVGSRYAVEKLAEDHVIQPPVEAFRIQAAFWTQN